MRKIKFKALRTDGKGWVYGDLLHVGLPQGGIFIKDHCGSTTEVNHSTICQYVCEDADENEVYVGDIVTYHIGSEWVVIYSPHSYSYQLHSFYNEYCEILGAIKQTGKNIHDAK